MRSRKPDETDTESPRKPPEDSLEGTLMGEHAPISERLQEHRLALMAGDLELARASYQRFRACLLAHLEFEEAEILPAYREHWDASNESPPRQFELEHEKLRKISSAIQKRLHAIEGSAEERLDLLDGQTFLRSLIEHHDIREGRVLYPFLSAKLTAEKQAAIRDRYLNARSASDPESPAAPPTP